MRTIIGEPYASELDRLVIKTMADTGMIEAVKSLAGEEKRLHFDSNSTIWSHDPASELVVSDLKKLGIL